MIPEGRRRGRAVSSPPSCRGSEPFAGLFLFQKYLWTARTKPSSFKVQSDREDTGCLPCQGGVSQCTIATGSPAPGWGSRAHCNTGPLSSSTLDTLPSHPSRGTGGVSPDPGKRCRCSAPQSVIPHGIWSQGGAGKAGPGTREGGLSGTGGAAANNGRRCGHTQATGLGVPSPAKNGGPSLGEKQRNLSSECQENTDCKWEQTLPTKSNKMEQHLLQIVGTPSTEHLAGCKIHSKGSRPFALAFALTGND